MRLACLGDLHGRFDAVDVGLLDGLGYDAVLVVGDLGGGRKADAITVARRLAGLSTPTFVIPGNHDGVPFPQLVAEQVGPEALAERLGQGMDARVAALADALAPARMVGFETVDLGPVRLVAGRPHSYGGPACGFVGYLRRRYGLEGMADATARLTQLLTVDDPRPVVVLAHNGPTGLGARRDAPFGRDFHRDEGDWGDPDLAAALDAARERGRPVAAVVAGHMHHALAGGGERATWGRRHETLVVNCARVPRIGRDGARHHVRLTVGDGGVEAATVIVRGDDVVVTPLEAGLGA
ncbi:MAG: metallophosphoesterase [Alphaproteobacteria bacterium]|nr:metallophosphoesterase [Alphaproteobacteria bacterium]